jgi:hypothetical protein
MSYPPPPGQSPYPSGPPPSGPPPYGGGYGAPPKHLRGRTPRRLGWIFLIVAVALFVAGGIVLGTKSYGAVNNFKRVSIASGNGTVSLSGTGKWIGYYEASNVDTGIDRIPNFEVALTSPSGKNVPLEPYGNRKDGKVDKLTYDYNAHKGAAAFQFNATEKGTYRVQLVARDTLPANADVAFGRDIVGATAAGALLIVGGVLFLIAAIVLLIVGFVKRSRHKKQLAAGAYGGGPPPNYPYPPQGQQPPSAWPATAPEQ